ncbi:MAG: hypothetical protein P4L69_24065 [Desulfosporosinus sp.]|nr:hypothetical protein [Desulfosporosinus sp.]
MKDMVKELDTPRLKLKSSMRAVIGSGRLHVCPALLQIFDSGRGGQFKNCNARHVAGQRFLLDVDGNFITDLCPKRMCVYLISQLTIPFALINERLSESLDSNDFHFMRYLRCPGTGVDCYGCGEFMLKVQVVPRIREKIIGMMAINSNSSCRRINRKHLDGQVPKSYSRS